MVPYAWFYKQDDAGWPAQMSAKDEAVYLAGLAEEERHCVVGLGGSQKAEVAWLDRKQIPYEEIDVATFSLQCMQIFADDALREVRVKSDAQAAQAAVRDARVKSRTKTATREARVKSGSKNKPTKKQADSAEGHPNTDNPMLQFQPSANAPLHTIVIESGTLGIAINSSTHPQYTMQVEHLTGKGDVEQLRTSGVRSLMLIIRVNGDSMQGMSYDQVRERIKERPCEISFAELHGPPQRADASENSAAFVQENPLQKSSAIDAQRILLHQKGALI
jgi:hypothetical protein